MWRSDRSTEGGKSSPFPPAAMRAIFTDRAGTFLNTLLLHSSTYTCSSTYMQSLVLCRALGEVQVRRVYPDIFDACSATCERENLNLTPYNRGDLKIRCSFGASSDNGGASLTSIWHTVG